VLKNKNIQLKFSKIILIGGGELLLHTATILKKKKVDFSILVSKRHSVEKFKDISFIDFLKKKKINYKVIKNINSNNLNINNIIRPNSLAICFGPSWIFSQKILKLFNYNMFNINLIPLPKYMGGAHFTWQILNNNFEGGIYFQKITDKLDRGPILLGKSFKIKKIKNPTPLYFFKENIKYGKKFVDSLVVKAIKNFKFKMKDFKKKYLSREYFPRLLSKKNAFINWSWSTKEIIDFCNAFDSPYSGAMTFYKKNKIFLKNVSLFQKKKFHPFASGIIIKIIKSDIYVVTKEGIIKIGVCLKSQTNINKTMRQGQRLITPHKYLDDGFSYIPKFN
jgi:methionyl-tRNA formyltransferase